MLSIFPLSTFLTSALFIFLSSPHALASEKGSPEYQQAIKAFEEEDRKLNQLWANLKDEIQGEAWPTLLNDQKKWLHYRDARSNGFHHPESRNEFTHYWKTSSKLTKLRTELLKDWKNNIKAPWTNDWSGYYTCTLSSEDSYLMIMHQGNNAWFNIKVTGGRTQHVGLMMGVAEINGNIGRYSDDELRISEIGETQSWLTLLRKVSPGEQLKIIESNAGIYHGIRASFDGHYIRRRDLTGEERREMMIKIKEWKELAKETRESQKKEKIDQKLRIKPYLDLYDESIRHLTESMMLVAGTLKKMTFDKNRENEFERALTKTDSTIVDERYRFLEDLPKERLKVWLDAYELYKRDKKARKTVTLTIAPSKLHNNISSQSKPLVEVHWEELEWRGEFTDSKIYIIGTDTPFTGISHRFHPNGMKSSQTSWKDGKRHGLSIGWHSNGLKSQEGLRLNDKRVGLWIYWYDNGQELYEKHYRNGKLDGSWVTWYQNGQMKQESSWKNGKQHGLLRCWHKNGQQLSEETWKNSTFVSRSEKYWNQKGERVASYDEAVKN